jgi:hypothetical protein
VVLVLVLMLMLVLMMDVNVHADVGVGVGAEFGVEYWRFCSCRYASPISTDPLDLWKSSKSNTGSSGWDGSLYPSSLWSGVVKPAIGWI